MRLVDRIRKYLKDKGLTPYEFEKKIEVGNGYLGKQAAGKGTVGSEVLEKIRRQYPDLNILWLLTGEGEPEISDNLHIQSEYPTAYPNTYPTEDIKQFHIVMERLKMTEILNESLKQQNAALQSSNADKDKIIAMLEEKLNSSKQKGK